MTNNDLLLFLVVLFLVCDREEELKFAGGFGIFAITWLACCLGELAARH
jgi:hypothetical protein